MSPVLSALFYTRHAFILSAVHHCGHSLGHMELSMFVVPEEQEPFLVEAGSSDVEGRGREVE